MKHLASYMLYIAARLGLAAITVFGVASLVFFGMRLIPGTYADLFFPLATEAERAEINAQYGLDAPVFVQYVKWIGAMLQGDFGTSIVTRGPVIDEVVARLPLTLELASLALIMIAFVGFPLGVVSGMFHGSAVSQTGRHASTLLMSIPNFVLGTVFLYLFSVYSLGLKAGGWSPMSDGLLENLRHALLPSFTLSITGLGLVLATARSSVLGVMGQDHILAAVSRGLEPRAIFTRHIFRNSLIPVVTIFAIVAGYLLGGTVLVETVFSLDGVGRLLVNSIIRRDYPVVQTGVILTAAFFVLMNTIADILYGFIDPRVADRQDG
ncbi:MAG: ABC transporter permease [Nitratireductor sp.]